MIAEINPLATAYLKVILLYFGVMDPMCVGNNLAGKLIFVRIVPIIVPHLLLVFSNHQPLFPRTRFQTREGRY
jgi:hypothetical protein